MIRNGKLMNRFKLRCKEERFHLLRKIQLSALGSGLTIHVQTEATSPVHKNADRGTDLEWNGLWNGMKFRESGKVQSTALAT